MEYEELHKSTSVHVSVKAICMWVPGTMPAPTLSALPCLLFHPYTLTLPYTYHGVDGWSVHGSQRSSRSINGNRWLNFKKVVILMLKHRAVMGFHGFLHSIQLSTFFPCDGIQCRPSWKGYNLPRETPWGSVPSAQHNILLKKSRNVTSWKKVPTKWNDHLTHSQ